MGRTRLLVLVLLALAAPAGALASPLVFKAPAGRWRHKTDPSGAHVFVLRSHGSTTTIVLGQLERASGTPTDFAQQIAQSPSTEFSNPSEVQIFTSPDKRAVVAVDGTLASDGHSRGRQCWVFDHGMRVLAEFLAPDDAAFKHTEAAFMAFVASVRLAAPPPSSSAQASSPPPMAAGPSSTATEQPPTNPTVDSTLTFTPPSGWSRADVGAAIWYQAPGQTDAPTYIMVTPAEVLHSDFPTWFERRLRPSAGMKIIDRGDSRASHSSSGYQLIRVRQVLSFHGVRHEQSVLAAHLGRAAVLVALDAPSIAALKAHEGDFAAFLGSLDIRPSVTGVAAGQAVAQPSAGAPPAAAPADSTADVSAAASSPEGFPSVSPPPGWTLTHSDQAWRTYAEPTSGTGGYLTMLVSQIAGGPDPVGSLARLRASLGIPGKRYPERIVLASGAVLFRTVDPASGQVPITEVVVLSHRGRQVLLMLRSSDATRFNASRPAFEAAIQHIHL